jgi:Arc/MetJ family transcription regulator
VRIAVSRTNIDLDDELVELVMKQNGLKTKREAVQFALEQVAVKPFTKEEILALEGTGWSGDLDAMRRMKPELLDWYDEQARKAGLEPPPRDPGKEFPKGSWRS